MRTNGISETKENEGKNKCMKQTKEWENKRKY